MSSYYEQTKNTIEQIPCNQIFVASELKNTHLSEIPEKTYYKILERLSKQEALVHLTKGLYYRPEHNEHGPVPINEKHIIEHYISNQSGIVIGEHLFQQAGLIPKTSEDIKILSNNLKEEKKHIGRIEVHKTNMSLDSDTIPMIETLEILQNYNKTENINKNRFLSYMRKFTEAYSDETAEYVIEHKKYKKSTIAFLERMLTWYGVENSLKQYLSPLSEYNIPSIAELKPSVPENIRTYLGEYVTELKKIYKHHLDKVILYGSYARGDYSDDSDIDIMILLRISDMDIKNYRHQLSELTYDFNTNYDIDIKPIAKSEETFTNWVKEYPFYANVERDGVELYGAA